MSDAQSGVRRRRGELQDASRTMYRVNGRLAMVRPGGAGADAWDARWGERDVARSIDEARRARLGDLDPIFERWLPKEGRILEAGCGWGRVVAALHARGHDIEGVDFAEDTIEIVRTAAPDLPVRVGDILDLDVPDASYEAYLSFGVLEHRMAGPEPGLAECARVLRPGGRALISVPHLTVARARVLRRAPEWSGSEDSTDRAFYQYYFSLREFSDLIREAGLRLRDTVPHALFSGITRDWALGRWLETRGFFHWRVRRRLGRIIDRAPGWAGRRWAHMMMYVCEKP